MRIAILVILISIGAVHGQFTPQQVSDRAAVYVGFSDAQLRRSQVALLASMVGVSSATSIMNLGAPFAPFSDRQLQQAIVALLNQLTVTNQLPFIGSLMVTNLGPPQPSSYWIYPITNSTTRYVETNGNDATAVAGDITHPWLTFNGAIGSATPGTRIKFGTGSWNIATTNGGYDVPLGLWLQGNGQGYTHLLGTNLGYWLNFTNNSIVADLSIEASGSVILTGIAYPVVFGPHDGRSGTWSPVTNVLFQNVRIDAATDTHSPNGDDIIDFVNCQFLSHWDTMTCKYAGTGNQNGKIRFFGCLFFARNDNDSDQTTYVKGLINSGGDLGGLYTSTRGNFEAHNCTFMLTNACGASGQSYPVLNNVGATAFIWIDNCTIVNQPASTNLLNIPGQISYYLVTGPALITGHPFPEDRCYQCTFTDTYLMMGRPGTNYNHTFAYTNGSWGTPDAIVSSSYITAGAGVTGDGATGRTNGLAGQFNYLNLQYSTNCAWGVLASNATAGTTLTLKGYEEFVVSAGATAVTLGDATTNLGHHISITCGSAGTNAINTVSSQKIAGVTKWTNTAIFTCTQLISDGANWQICGTRGN